MEDALLTFLDPDDVQFIRVLWCDNANIIRGKAIHSQRLPEYLAHGVGISAAQQAVPVMYDVPVRESGLGSVGEIRLLPDWNTLKVLPYASGHVRVMGDMFKDGQPWSCCPRHFLKRAIAAMAEAGLEVKAAFENEFYLLHSSPSLHASPSAIAPADNTVFASTLSMDMHQEIINDIAKTLITQGIIVEQYHPESGPGQQEISVVYVDALAAADQQIAFRETVRAIARQHQLIASFLPKIFAKAAGSGCHLHFSLWQEGNNILSDPKKENKLSSIASSFIAGVLDRLPALMAITTPSPNSYRRIIPHGWSGAFRCWGFDNREAAIRVPTNPASPSPTHIEFKTVDAAANPYLALGAMIFAGLDGIRRHLKLSESVNADPGNLSETERQVQNIDFLPTNLGESIELFKQDNFLLDAMGADLAKAYLAVRSAEWEAMKDWSLEEELKLLLERY
jgi:glutamine synthetase